LNLFKIHCTNLCNYHNETPFEHLMHVNKKECNTFKKQKKKIRWWSLCFARGEGRKGCWGGRTSHAPRHW
jgi:hypothetical protein